jgi:hypothetical protein
VEQRQWAGPTIVGIGIRVCTRTCLDELQQNGFRTIVIGPDPVPLKNARPTSYRAQSGPAFQFVEPDPDANEPAAPSAFPIEFDTEFSGSFD